jgi:cell shape-determining protein MreC
MVNAKRANNRRKLGEHYQAELKRLSKKLMTAKRNARETFLSSVLKNEGKSWSEFCRFVNRRKGNKESIPAMKDCNGGLITDPVDKTNNLNNYYASVFSCERDIPDINLTHSDKTFTIKIALLGSG